MDHWRGLAEFSRFERAVGGPDPHMATAGYLVAGEDWADRLWMAGCYVAVYNVPGATVLHSHWTPERVRADPEGLRRWLENAEAPNKLRTGIPMRRERRKPAGTPTKLTAFLHSYAEWMADRREWSFLRRVGDEHDRYEQAWQSAGRSLKFFGRYANLKLMEFLRRYCDVPIAQLGIRARGGWSPKECLALLWPEHAARLKGAWQDTPPVNSLAEDLAAWTQAKLAMEWGEELDWYTLQVLLCDYKQSVNGRQYPGRSLDSELSYAADVELVWPGLLNEFWRARGDLFPPAALGELGGWVEVRKELGKVLGTYGYTWSDLNYDYLGTADLAVPTRRNGRQLEVARVA